MIEQSYRPRLTSDAIAELAEFCKEQGFQPNRFVAIAIKEAIARRTKKDVSISSLGQSE